MTNENEVLDGVTQPGYDLICLLSLPDPYFWLIFRAQLARQALHSLNASLLLSRSQRYNKRDLLQNSPPAI